MSIQSYEFGDQSTIINQSVGVSNGSARARRKKNSQSGSPYNTNKTVNPRQAWLNSMNQGNGFSNTIGSYSKLNNYSIANPSAKPLPKTKSVNPASHFDKEEMYDEIQKLKETIAAFSKEKSLLNTKITKLEKELNKKDKMLDDTYSQSQSVFGTLTERSTNSNSTTVTGLKQKCHKYECLIRDKDNELKLLKANIKSTRLQELEIMCETYYEEIQRLTSVIEQKQFDMNMSFTPRASTPMLTNEKERILESKIKQLELDNATLKKEMLKTSNKPLGETGVLSEYAALSRSDLETQYQSKSKELFDANLSNDVLKTKCNVLEEEIKQMKAGQIKQEENTSQLRDNREKLQSRLSTAEGENHAQKLVIKRLNKTVKSHEDEIENLKKQLDKDRVLYKDKMKLKTDKIDELADQTTDLKEKLQKAKTEMNEARKAESEIPKIDAVNVEEVKSIAPVKKEQKVEPEDKEKRTEMKKTDSVARTPKRKNLRDAEKEKEKEKKKEERKQRLLEDKAARTIQKNFRNYTLVKSVCLIQQLFRGHSLRAQKAKSEHDESAQIIQNSLRSYQYKQKHIKLLNAEHKRDHARDTEYDSTVKEPDSQLRSIKDDTKRSRNGEKKSTAKRELGFRKTSETQNQDRKKVSDKSLEHKKTVNKSMIKEPPIKPATVRKPIKETQKVVQKHLEESTDEDDLIMM